jgi:hypothetical protein
LALAPEVAATLDARLIFKLKIKFKELLIIYFKYFIHNLSNKSHSRGFGVLGFWGFGFWGFRVLGF